MVGHSISSRPVMGGWLRLDGYSKVPRDDYCMSFSFGVKWVWLFLFIVCFVGFCNRSVLFVPFRLSAWRKKGVFYPGCVCVVGSSFLGWFRGIFRGNHGVFFMTPPVMNWIEERRRENRLAAHSVLIFFFFVRMQKRRKNAVTFVVRSTK